MKKPARGLWLGLWGTVGFLAAEKNLWAATGGGRSGFTGEVAWQIIGFILVFGFLTYVLRKPVRTFLGKRREEIKNSLDQAARKQTESQAKLEGWEKKLNSLSQEINELHQAITQEGEVERRKMTERAQEEGERIRAQARVITEQEVRKARATLKKEMVDLSVELSERLLKESVQSQDQDRLAREYIEKMGEAR